MAWVQVIINLLITSSLYIWSIFISSLKYILEFSNIFSWFVFFLLQILFKTILNFVKSYFKIIYLTTTIKLVCLVTLCYHAYLLSYDYFTYPYQFKIIVGDNKDGFDVPQITVCTKQGIIFNKQRIIEYFDLKLVYDEYVNKCKMKQQNNIDNCIKNKKDKHEYCSNFLRRFQYYYELDEFFREYENIITCFLQYNERIILIMNAEEMFNWKAKIHKRGDDNQIYDESYLDSLDIIENIINENGLGVCFTFFSRNYSILLKQNDFIEFNIKYESQSNLLNLINMTQIEDYFTFNKLRLDPNAPYPNLTIESVLDAFTLNYIVKSYNGYYDDKYHIISTIKRSGFKANLKFQTTSVFLLSTPYMDNCNEHGKYK